MPRAMNARPMSKFRLRVLAVAALCTWMFGTVARAVQSPMNCNGNGLVINIQRSPASVVVGGTVSYDILVGNLNAGTLISCDTSDVDIVFFCPDATGQPDLTMPRVLT